MSLLLHSWPSAILHLDADAFFASVEQAIHPALKGKPVITGAERGIVAAASYEAKGAGVKRGMRLFEARKVCPSVVCLPSDYETYSLFSKRMFVIMRRYTPDVEEYSIDEAFADLSGLRRLYHSSFGGIARQMKEEVEKNLGITVSVGLSLSKSLAKLASKLNKPSGLVIVPGRKIEDLLAITPLEKVWGFGRNTVALLQKVGARFPRLQMASVAGGETPPLRSALDFIKMPENLAQKFLGKIGLEIHRELSGQSVYPVVIGEKSSYVTISKVKTFTPPSNNRDFVYAQALRNLEGACMKARRYNLYARRLSLFLRQQNFHDEGMEVKLARPTMATLDLKNPLSELFALLYRADVLYRSTGVVLGDLSVEEGIQFTLFENPVSVVKAEEVSKTVDEINGRFGKHKVHLAGSLAAQKRHEGTRGELPERKKDLLKGENFRQHLEMPLLRHQV